MFMTVPEPDPQPPQPCPVSAARWLLMLTPSVLAIAAPFIGELGGYAVNMRGEQALGATIGFILLMLALATVLCFVLGFLLVKWRGGSLRDRSRPIGYGVLILIMNGIIAFAGCATTLR